MQFPDEAGQIHVLGVGDARQLFKSDDLQKIQAASGPCDHILLNEHEVGSRIRRLRPAKYI